MNQSCQKEGAETAGEKAPAFVHTPVLMREVLEALRPQSGRSYLDGTLGGGGHAEAVLEASSPSGCLYGCDRDLAAIRAASERLARFGSRVAIWKPLMT